MKREELAHVATKATVVFMRIVGGCIFYVATPIAMMFALTHGLGYLLGVLIAALAICLPMAHGAEYLDRRNEKEARLV